MGIGPRFQYISFLLQLYIQWNLSIKDLQIEDHLSNQDTACCPSYAHREVY